MITGIDLILADHRRVDALFEQLGGPDDGPVIGMIMDALTAHDQAEQAALYPLTMKLLGPEIVERSELAHSRVKKLMDEIRQLEGAPLRDAVDLLRELVTEHVQDEESNLLPALSEAASAAELDGLAARIEQNKQRVG
jgi:hemerythrin superfamily protein